MRFKFLGRGSAFNIEDGNTAAFYKNDDKMLLIDCGEDTFSVIKRHNILKGVNKLYIVITHTHADHIASLSDLCFYYYFCLNCKANIVLCDDKKLEKNIKNVIESNGITKNIVNFVTTDNLLKEFDEFENFEYVLSPHVKNMPCYGILIKHKVDGITYYSSDTYDTTVLKSLISNNKNKIDAIYMETCKLKYAGNPHLYKSALEEAVPQNLRKKVWCMHLDDSSLEPELLALGFNVVNPKKDLEKF